MVKVAVVIDVRIILVMVAVVIECIIVMTTLLVKGSDGY